MLIGMDVQRAEVPGQGEGHEPFILTYMRKQFYYGDFSTEDIVIEDIAHSLAQIPRFTGHLNAFLSVAQHSMLVADRMPGTPEEKLVGLLHDAAEAYTNDLASPLKTYLRESGSRSYGDLQARITATVYNRFGVTKIPATVREHDSVAALYEAQGFMDLPLQQLSEYGFDSRLAEEWDPWDPHDYAATNLGEDMSHVEFQFIKKFEDLMKACGREELI